MYCDKLKMQVQVSSDQPVVVTKKGKLAGLKKNQTYIFRGIRYAKARRFHEPMEVENWDGIKSAVSYGYVCPEPVTAVPRDNYLNPHYYMPQDEHCQYLNIWTPELGENALKPVMIWIHGGAWVSGSGVEQYAYDGEELASFGDVVVITFNHRLHALGALDLSGFSPEYEKSGYCGFLDILMCLKWVKENIAAFGGNPENITLFGQSGGVAKILNLMQCPQADGLFQRVAINSGGLREQAIPKGWTGKELTVRMAELTVSSLGVTKGIREIEAVPYWELAGAVMQAESILRKETGLNQAYRWEPVPDGKIILGSTLRDGFRIATKDIPMLIGNVFGEENSNAVLQNPLTDGPKNQWDMKKIAKLSQERWGQNAEKILREFIKTYPENCPADVLFMDYAEREGQLAFVKERVETGGKVWNWLFKKESPFLGGLVAWHCSEIPYVFHNTSYMDAAFEPGVSEKLENIMCGAWVNFAKYGDPNGKGIPKWHCVTAEETPTMIFDTVSAERVNHDQCLRNMLREAEKPRQTDKKGRP